jgi:hypothetical protein
VRHALFLEVVDGLWATGTRIIRTRQARGNRAADAATRYGSRVDRDWALRLLISLALAVGAGGVAAILVVRGLSAMRGIPPELVRWEPWLLLTGYVVWAAVALLVSAAWLWWTRAR